VVLSQQVKALIGEGNQAYIDGRIQESVQIMQEVIRIEPRAMSAWSVLANCYHDLGQPQKALQLRVMGAHLHHDAEEWERLAKESRCAYAPAEIRHGYMTIAGSWALISKRCTATEKFTV